MIQTSILKNSIVSLSVVLAFSTFSVLAHAEQYNAGGIITQVDTSWVTGQVREEALAMTKTLSRPVVTYHWVPRKYVSVDGKQFPITGPVKADEFRELVLKNAMSRMARFWDTKIAVSGRGPEGAMAPNGLYTANEPIISHSYGTKEGGDAWMVYQMQFPKGMLYIDGRYKESILKPNLIKALNERGCATGEGFSARALIKSDTDKVACRQALNDIAAALDVKAITYSFEKEPLTEDCPTWSSAFVVIRPDAVSEFQFLVKDSPQTPDGSEYSRGIINGMFVRAKQRAIFSNAKEASQDEVKKYIKENYFTCNSSFRE